MAVHATGGAERIVLPLDVPTLAEAGQIAEQMRGSVGVLKVGLGLFTAHGPDAVKMVHDQGADCFLDLKLHDIPRTVASAVESAVRLGVRYLTVHTAGGRRAMAAAYAAAQGSDTRLLGVTVLTSMEQVDLSEVGIEKNPGELVLERADLALSSGIDGIVCAASECQALRTRHGQEPLLVVPGIRPEGSQRGDQRRVATPAEAVRRGASLLVVGRPILQAPDRPAAARNIAREIQASLPGQVS